MPICTRPSLTVFRCKDLLVKMFFCLSLWLPSHLFGQSFTPDPDWRFENFNNQNHFANAPVAQLAVDRKGYVWTCGTGLRRFDGINTIDFGGIEHTKYGLRGNYPGIFRDNAGNVWVTCRGICRYDDVTNRFIYVKADPKRNFTDAESFCTQSYNLWFVTEFGLLKLDTRTLKISYSSLTGIHDPLCTSMINDSTLFVSSREKIYYYNIRKDTWTSATLVYNRSLVKIFSIYKAGERFYFGTNNGLFVLDQPDKITAVCPETRDVNINALTVLPADKAQKYLLLAWEGEGIQVYNTKDDKIEFKYLHDDNNPFSIPSDGITCFFVDDKKRMWLGADVGMSLLDLSDQRFRMRFLNKSDAYQDGINKIAIDKYDTAKAWMCSYNQGMISINWKTKQVERIYNDVPFARRLYDFAQVTKKRWLIATQKELMEWSPATGPKLRLKLPVPDSIALVCNIKRIIVADANTCYITTNYGLFKYDLSTRKISAASAASVRRSGVDPLQYILLEGFREKGALWIASRNGVFRYELADGSVNVRRGKGNFGDYFLFDVTNTTGDDLVCAAGQGITIFNKKKRQYRIVNRLGNFDGPGCLSVFAIKSTVWIGTDQGILTYDLESGKSREAQLSRSLGDIFPTSPFALIGKQLVYGFRNGFAYFKPETRDDQTPSDPLIERVFVNNQPVTQSYHNTGLVFTYAENSFNFFFTAFQYNYPEDIRFRFRLKGIDKSWQNVDNQRSANYAQLPPGGYTFYVQSGNKNGFWNSHIASFTFRIDPPYWATWWFRVLIVAAIALGLYRLYRYKIEHLQAIEQIRANIAADFHDDLGSTLSSISIFSQVAIQKAETDLPATKSMVGDIGTRARAMIHSMNDMVWIIKPENDSLFKLMQRMEEFGYPVAEAKDIPLKFVMDKGLHDVKLDMLTRKNLFLIFKEAFNNAVKYACAKNISIQFELKQKKMLTIQIVDNGCGFESDGNKRGNGLGNMQKRAAEMRGKLKIITAPGKGTTIQVTCEIT